MASPSSSQSQAFPSLSTQQISKSFETGKSQSSQETLSWSDYFREGTSKIGCSLENASGSSNDIRRPDFGLPILKSPKHRPIKVIEGTDTEDSVETSSRKVNCNSKTL